MGKFACRVAILYISKEGMVNVQKHLVNKL